MFWNAPVRTSEKKRNKTFKRYTTFSRKRTAPFYSNDQGNFEKKKKNVSQNDSMFYSLPPKKKRTKGEQKPNLFFLNFFDSWEPTLRGELDGLGTCRTKAPTSSKLFVCIAQREREREWGTDGSSARDPLDSMQHGRLYTDRTAAGINWRLRTHITHTHLHERIHPVYIPVYLSVWIHLNRFVFVLCTYVLYIWIYIHSWL